MQFAGKTASVADISQEAANEFLTCGDCLSILPASCGAGITPGEERGAAGCANGALAIGFGKCHALLN